MLKNLVGLSQGSVKGLDRSFVDAPTAALYGCLTFAMLTITYGAGASLGVITPVLQVASCSTPKCQLSSQHKIHVDCNNHQQGVWRGIYQTSRAESCFYEKHWNRFVLSIV